MPSTLLAVPNVTAHPSAASVPITVLLYSGLLLCSSNVPLTLALLCKPVSIVLFKIYRVSQNKIHQHQNRDIYIMQKYFYIKCSVFIQHMILLHKSV